MELGRDYLRLSLFSRFPRLMSICFYIMLALPPQTRYSRPEVVDLNWIEVGPEMAKLREGCASAVRVDCATTEAGQTVAAVCRPNGLGEQTFDRPTSNYGRVGRSVRRRLK